MVEFGHPKEDVNEPIINYAIAFDCNNSKPMYYEDYPGGGFTKYFDLIYFHKGKGDEKFMYGRERQEVILQEVNIYKYKQLYKISTI